MIESTNIIADRYFHGKSLLIFDDQLRSMDGHWFEYDRAVVEMHRALGVKVTVICHTQFDGREELELAGAEVLPLIDKSVATGDYAKSSGLISEMLLTIRQAASYRRILHNHFKSRDYNCVFMPNAMVYDSLAWCLLRLSSGSRSVRRSALLFRFGIGDYSQGRLRFARKLAVLRAALRCHLAELSAGKLVILTDSDRLANDYETVSGIRPRVVPSPRTLPEPKVDRTADDSRPLVFATIGYARYAKGIDLFQKAIVKLLDDEEVAKSRFVLQWSRDVLLPDGSVYPRDPRLEASPRVQFIDRPLGSTDYAALFSSIDCMVLPYRRDAYRSQISGIAVEAACAAMPIIYTEDTWIADFVAQQGAGISVRDGDVDSLVDAMKLMATNRRQYLEDGKISGIEARRRNGAEAFVRLLWGDDVPPIGRFHS